MRAVIPQGLERRLLSSYFGVFVGVLAIFGVMTHVAFAAIFQREMTEQLDAMLKVGESVVDATGNQLSVDLSDETVRAFNPRTEGLRWRDAGGRVVASYGLAPPGESVRTRTAVFAVGDRAKRNVVVTASLSEAHMVDRLRAVDLSILVGFALAALGSLIAGRRLTHAVVRGLEANLRTLQDFTADAAHELRGPLTAVAANAANAVPLGEEGVVLARGAMEAIVSATTQMIRVSEDLLVLARANQPLGRELFAVDLDQSIATVVALYAEEARQKGLTLETTIADRIRIYGNPDQIERILGNLVQNAIRYTPSGGTVTIACSKDRNAARVTVTDTGIGIAPEIAERIFERFWRVDSSRSSGVGSGLGLTIARELARRHGGDVTVESTRDSGSRFTLTLPLRPPRDLKL